MMKLKILCSGLFVVMICLLGACTAKKPVAAAIQPEYAAFNADKPKSNRKEKFAFLKDSPAEDRWVDSVYNSMAFSERVGQLFMVAAYSNKDSAHIRSVEKLITDYKVGGLIFFQGGPARQARLTNYFQSKSDRPLFIGIDAEWGVSMRLDSTYRFPWNMTLGAIRDKSLIERVGRQMGLESKRLGIHFNFAPVLDINTNPRNPIIGFRSFGEEKENVTTSAIAMMRGVQGQGVFSTGKHFPGHGDTETDSHYALPLVNFSKERIDNVELYPYKQMFDEGLVSVMVAHLNVPALEARDNVPSSVSYSVVTDLLQKEMGFDGLVFTDALNMKAAANHRAPGEIDLEAFLAGNDILLFPESVPTAVDMLCEAYYSGILTESRLAESVKKILRFKYKAGLDSYTPVQLAGLQKDLNPETNIALQYELYENAVTVIKNDDALLPLKDLKQKIAYVKLGDDIHSPFLESLRQYTDIKEVAVAAVDTMNMVLAEYDIVIVGFHKSDRAWKNHDFLPSELQLLQGIAVKNKVVLDVFTKPYSLSAISDFSNIESVVVSYQNAEIAQKVSAQVIFGAITAKGALPVSVNDMFPAGTGMLTPKLDRLGFTHPINAGMDPNMAHRIDQQISEAIKNRMTPGAQILVARNGKVVMHKSYGFHTYDNLTKVSNTDLYDVASLTKILATLPLAMQQFEKGNLTEDTSLGEMLPLFADTDKKDIRLKEFLSHYAGFEAWSPFYKETLDASAKPDARYYRRVAEPGFTTKVADSLFITDSYNDVILKKIASSKLSGKKEYKYSDYTFILLKEYLEEATGKTLDLLAYENFYSILGTNNTLFNPLQKCSLPQIPPTEVDNYFRYQTVHGYVHDMTAAMMGGVAGHAGLFSTSMDVAKIMQMFLQKGSYGGDVFFSPDTFDFFNKCYFCADGNRRALGFDKPQLPGTAGPTCNCVSQESFGHTGFTGTYAWADPASGVVYVFLSNRSFPDSAVNNLSKANVRENIQKIIQESIIN